MSIEEKIDFLVELAQSKSTDPEEQITYLTKMCKLKLKFVKSELTAGLMIYEYQEAISRIKNGIPSPL